MAMLFPWATKEYLLWSMSLSQIVLYHNYATAMTSGAESEDLGKPKKLSECSYEELAAVRKEMVDSGLISAEETVNEGFKKRYGDIGQ